VTGSSLQSYRRLLRVKRSKPKTPMNRARRCLDGLEPLSGLVNVYMHIAVRAREGIAEQY
jgi:hypothetical protein